VGAEHDVFVVMIGDAGGTNEAVRDDEAANATLPKSISGRKIKGRIIAQAVVSLSLS
jgi:hypothetical protein